MLTYADAIDITYLYRNKFIISLSLYFTEAYLATTETGPTPMIDILAIETRQKWLRGRKGVLGCSDLGAVIGVDDYRSPLSVYADKMSLDIDESDNPLMRRGRNMEPAIIEYLKEDHPELTFSRPNAFYLDEEHGLGASPDCFARDREGRLINYQLKTVAKPKFETWDGKLPLSYVYQTMGENLLVDADRGVCAVYVISSYTGELHEFDVPRHPAAEARLYEIAEIFWQNIADGVVPRPNYREDGEIIAAMHPPTKDEPVLDLTADNRIYALLEERSRLKDVIMVSQAEVEALKDELVEKLAGHTKAVANGWKISRKMQHRNEHVVAAVDFPDLRVYRTKDATT